LRTRLRHSPNEECPSVPEWDRQFRLVRVHHEHREELGRLRLAGIGADAVAVAGQLGEALSGLVGRHRSVVDLTADRPLKHGRVDEGGFLLFCERRFRYVDGQAALPRFDFPLGNRLGVFKIGQRDKCFIGRVKQIPDVKTNAVYRFNGVLGSMNLTTHLWEK
jgi:hypothetical protein